MTVIKPSQRRRFGAIAHVNLVNPSFRSRADEDAIALTRQGVNDPACSKNLARHPVFIDPKDDVFSGRRRFRRRYLRGKGKETFTRAIVKIKQRKPFSSRRGLIGRSREDRAVAGDRQRADLALSGVENDRNLAVAGHAIQNPFAVAPRIDRAVLGDDDAKQVRVLRVENLRPAPFRRSLPKLAVGTGRGVKVSGRVGGDIPDVTRVFVDRFDRLLGIAQANDLPRRPRSRETLSPGATTIERACVSSHL